MTDILALDAVTKTYATRKRLMGKPSPPVVALAGISLTIGKGEIFGLVGESGSGKTTTGRLILKLESADTGTIHLNGTDVTGLRGRNLKRFRRQVQMIFQDPYQSLNPHLSVKEAVTEPLAIHGIGDPTERHQRALDMLDTVGLEPAGDYLPRYPHQLSGGQRQRVAIARAMILKPTLVVADEPTSMLDASISVQVFNILKTLQREQQISFLFITHSLAAAHYLCDRIAVIYRGHIVETGDAKATIRNPRHPYTKALMDALPAFGQDWEKSTYGTLLETARDVDPHPGCIFYHRCRLGEAGRCDAEKPELRALDPDHAAACFFA
ncbi:MAG: oligopeptide/dipeptide ABC transporter ATP-binding protein [Pseudomonadota bacterium]